MKRFWASLGDVFTVVLLSAFVIIGWVLNLKAVWASSVLDGETIVRAIAIILWPIGCIIGWFT